MSNFTDRFGGGGAGGSFLGIEPPKNSTEFNMTQNTSAASDSGSLNVSFTDKGRNLPVSDTVYAGLALPILAISGGNSYARGRLPNRNAVWTLPSGSMPDSQSTFARAYWYDPVNNFLYILTNNNTSTLFARAIVKVNALTGAATTLHLFSAAISMRLTGANSGNLLYPDNTSTPDTANWTILHSTTGTPNVHQESIIDNTGTVVSTTSFKVDTGDTNQDVDGTGGYVTADKTLIASDWGYTTVGSTAYSTFMLKRGPSKNRIVYVPDGILPFVNNDIDVKTPDSTNNDGHLITLWGLSSVAFMSGKTKDSVTDFKFCYGRRLLDRVDFDRWLQDVANFYNMPAGEAYF